MVDWTRHYDAIYGSIGVSAVLTLDDTDGTEVSLTVIDKTEGVVVEGDGGINVQSIRPAAVVRMRELTDNGVSPDDLDGTTIAFSNSTRTVHSHRPKPAPTGQGYGELYLLLVE